MYVPAEITALTVPADPLLELLFAAASFTRSAAADFLGAFASSSSFKGLVWDRKSYHLLRCGSLPDLRIFSHCKLALMTHTQRSDMLDNSFLQFDFQCDAKKRKVGAKPRTTN